MNVASVKRLVDRAMRYGTLTTLRHITTVASEDRPWEPGVSTPTDTYIKVIFVRDTINPLQSLLSGSNTLSQGRDALMPTYPGLVPLAGDTVYFGDEALVIEKVNPVMLMGEPVLWFITFESWLKGDGSISVPFAALENLVYRMGVDFPVYEVPYEALENLIQHLESNFQN